MRRRLTQRLVARLCVAAFLVAGSGLANQLVYCIGADGHSAIERVHATAACRASSQRLAPGAAALALDACTDLPLLVEASKGDEQPSQPGLRIGLAASTFPRTEPPAPPRIRPHGAPGLIRQGTASLKITVLRV